MQISFLSIDQTILDQIIVNGPNQVRVLGQVVWVEMSEYVLVRIVWDLIRRESRFWINDHLLFCIDDRSFCNGGCSFYLLFHLSWIVIHCSLSPFSPHIIYRCWENGIGTTFGSYLIIKYDSSSRNLLSFWCYRTLLACQYWWQYKLCYLSVHQNY